MSSVKKSRRSQPHENPVKLKIPGENDILCGKDRACALHKGSQHFRAVIDSYRSTYQKAVTKYDKMQLTKEIYNLLSQDSRFLKYNDKEQLWEEITPLQGRDKIGHALRFANNHSSGPKGSKGKGKKARRGLRRQGSFSSTSATSASASATASTSVITKPSKAELVASVVEVVKDEPKVWDTLVDHLAHQEPPVVVPDPATSSRAHNRVASLVDPLALENIAYAVESNTEDAALDDLISLLNDENIITEETLQDVLDMAAEEREEEVIPPTISLAAPAIVPPLAPPVVDDSLVPPVTDDAAPAVVIDRVASCATATSTSSDVAVAAAAQTPQGTDSHDDDDMWAILKEPLLDFDDFEE